jgi:pimeloyl-ACP methyl ester carboxylesterase
MVDQAVKMGLSRIVVERSGCGAPVVVLHGENGARSLNPLVDGLGRHFDVHVPRLVGWPNTVRDPNILTIRDVALVAQEYIEGLKGPVPVIGASLGGWVAAEIAATVPSLISSLILIAPIGVKIGGREDRDFVDLYILGAEEREALYYARGVRPAIAHSDGTDIFLEKALAEEATVRYCWQPYMHDPTLNSRLRRIRAATLLLSGGMDKFVLNPDYYSGYASLIPGARHEVIADSGHRLAEEEPERVADRVAAFVATAGSDRR